MPNNTDVSQKQRRKEAIGGTVFCGVVLLVSAGALLFLRSWFAITGFWGVVMVLAALGELGTLLSLVRLLHIRLKEIEGGEEDAAAQY